MKAFHFCLMVVAVFLAGALTMREVPLVHAQPINARTDFQFRQQIPPAYIPTTPTDLFTRDVYVNGITLTNRTNSDVTCTITDKQATPMEVTGSTSVTLSDKNVKAGTYQIIPGYDRFMPGGIRWSCDTANAVVGYISVKY